MTFIIATASHISLADQMPPPRYGENLVNNPGFESNAISWKIKPATAHVVSDVSHSGKNSLYYENNDPQQYELFTQTLNVQPGQTLHFSAWIKTENLTATDAKPTASLYLETGAGGMYPMGISGTTGWTKVSGTYTVPPEINTVSLGLRFLKGSTGKAWFDDVEVRAEIPPLLQSFLLKPAYRGLIKTGDNSPWKVLTQVRPDQNSNPADHLTTKATLQDAAGKVLLEKQFSIPLQQGDQTLTINPPTKLAPGNYQLTLASYLADGSLYRSRQHALRVVAQLPNITFDDQGFMVKEGKRFFPFGLYLGPTEATHLARIADAGFNTVLSYSYGQAKDPLKFMERAKQQHLNVIFSLKDFYAGTKYAPKDSDPLAHAKEYVDLLKDNDALLAWYINDELHPEWIPKIEAMQNMIAKQDLNHPTFQVLYQVGQLEKYFYAADIIATDPYPVGRKNLSKTSEYTQSTVAAAHGARAPWIVPQIMDWAVYTPNREPHPPTLDEMRNQVFQAIINGARGIIFYSYQDLFQEKYPRGPLNQEAFDRRWPDVVAMSQEINKLIPTLLQGKSVLLNATSKSKIEYNVLEYNNQLHLLLANPHYQEENINITLPSGWKPASPVQGQIKSTFTGNQLALTVPSIGSGVFTLVKE